MKEMTVKEVLENLYKMDEEGKALEGKLDIVEDEFYHKLLENLKKSEREYMKSARLDAKRKTKEILKETIEKEQAIMESCYKEMDRLDDLLLNHKEILIKKVFEHVFLER